MHILIVSCVFPPEPVTSAITSEQLAQELIFQGHQVTVISSFPNRPGGKLYAGYEQRLAYEETTSVGYKLIRTFSAISRRSTAKSRLLENISFGLTSTLQSFNIEPDVVYANTWPLFANGMLTVLCAIRKLPLVINIQDIYPESAIELGKLSGKSRIAQILRDLDTWIAQQATSVVTLSENFVKFYQSTRHLPVDKIHLVYNWLDEEAIEPGLRFGNFRKEQEIPETTFVVMYAGNIGVNAGVEFVVEAAKLLRGVPDILFIIAGDGTCKNTCQKMIESYSLSNIQIFSPLPKKQFADVQASADLMILPTRKSGSITSVPSKLIAYMLSGRPILAAVDRLSDTARIINEAHCGICVQAEDVIEISKAIISLKGRTDELSEMRIKARNYALKNFTAKACLPKLVRIIESAGAKSM